MNWTTSKLKNYILEAVKTKSTLVPNEGELSNAIKTLIDILAADITDIHSKWQQEVLVNGIIFNGGVCLDGTFIGPAIGISSPSSFSKMLGVTELYNTFVSRIPNGYFQELTTPLNTFLKAVGVGFTKTYNEWLLFATFIGVLIMSGVTTCTAIAPVGTFSGIGSAPSLLSSIPLKIKKQEFLDNIKEMITSDLMQSNETELSNAMNDFIEAIVEGILEMQKEWLTATKLQNVQATGVAIYGSPVSGAIGNGGFLV